MEILNNPEKHKLIKQFLHFKTLFIRNYVIEDETYINRYQYIRIPETQHKRAQATSAIYT
jgi:hypothetical protein